MYAAGVRLVSGVAALQLEEQGFDALEAAVQWRAGTALQNERDIGIYIGVLRAQGMRGYGDGGQRASQLYSYDTQLKLYGCEHGRG